MMQCLSKYREAPPQSRKMFPHAYNAMKYLMGVVVMVLAMLTNIARDQTGAAQGDYASPTAPASVEGLFVVWLVVSTLNATVRSWWNAKVDVGLGERLGVVLPDPAAGPKNQPGRIWLGPLVGYYSMRATLFPQWVYYLFLAYNTFMRFSWILQFSMRAWLVGEAEWLSLLWGVLYVLRFALWVTVRVECDQMSNVELYKIVTTAPVVMALQTTLFTGGGGVNALADGIWDPATKTLALPLVAPATDTQHIDAITNDAITNALRVDFRSLEHIDRFFALLPDQEKLAILSVACPDKKWRNVVGEGKSHWFRIQSEETKVHALLCRIGPKRTLAQYATDVNHQDVTPAAMLSAAKEAAVKARTAV